MKKEPAIYTAGRLMRSAADAKREAARREKETTTKQRAGAAVPRSVKYELPTKPRNSTSNMPDAFTADEICRFAVGDGDGIEGAALVAAWDGDVEKAFQSGPGRAILRRRGAECGLVSLAKLQEIRPLSYSAIVSGVAQGIFPAPTACIAGMFFWSRADFQTFADRYPQEQKNV